MIRAALLAAIAGGSLSACATVQPTPKLTPAVPARDDIRQLKLADWQPRSMLRTQVSRVDRPAFPVIDVHNHLGDKADPAELVRVMDRAGVKAIVNLDGEPGEPLARLVTRFDRAYPGRFYTFALIDFSGIDDADWSARTAAQLERDFAAGAKGLKLHKSLGLTIRYRNGKLMRIDDPKLDPVWRLSAKHKRPVMIHTADPAAFFTPLDRHNERWHELNAHPDWLFHDARFPRREELHRQRNNVIARHPATTFVGAHFGNNPEDLATVGRWLEQYPNFHVDIDARISELGRQPRSARRFFIKHQDRIMFGTDTFPTAPMYRIYYRFLETDDEYWDVAQGHHRQGFWNVHSLRLPKDVLRKLYQLNAEKLLGVAPAASPLKAELKQVEATIKAGRYDEAARLLARARERAGADWSLTNAVVQLEATLRAYQGRYEDAAAVLLARLPAAATRRAEDWTEWGMHHTLALLHAARGDVAGALLAIRQARWVGEQGRWTLPGRTRMMQIRLGDSWSRAHLLRLRAEQLKGAARAAVLHFAEEARSEYRQLAPQDGGHEDSVAVLDVIFAVHDKQPQQALAAARQVRWEKNDDIEDLYLTWVGFDYGGDATTAAAVHARMKSLDYVSAGSPLRLRWVEYDQAAKRSGRARFTPRHPTGRTD